MARRRASSSADASVLYWNDASSSTQYGVIASLTCLDIGSVRLWCIARSRWYTEVMVFCQVTFRGAGRGDDPNTRPTCQNDSIWTPECKFSIGAANLPS